MKNDPVIIALDFESAAEAGHLVASPGESASFYKVGMELRRRRNAAALAAIHAELREPG